MRAARSFVREQVGGWEVSAATANAVIDVGHELVANALLHGRPPITLELQLTQATLLVLVTDGSAESVRTLPYRPGVSERGLGLRLVGQLSSAWGQHHADGRKTVWAAVQLAPGR